MTEKNNGKKEYSRPAITELGSVVQLTEGVSEPVVDNNGVPHYHNAANPD